MHATMCDYLADTVQNSIEAGASVIDVSLSEEGGVVSVEIRDNGKGMDAATLARVWDPFYTEPGKHAKRRVGLGLPLLRQMAEGAEGGVSLASVKGVGTTLSYRWQGAHCDAPPFGDIPATLVSLMNYPGGFELNFTHSRGGGASGESSSGGASGAFSSGGASGESSAGGGGVASYTISRSELIEALGGIETADNILLARDFIAGQEEELASAASTNAASASN